MSRIAVRHLYFLDNTDIQGASQISNLRCYPDPPQQPNWWSCVFFPDLQQFEITWHRTGVPDSVRMMPVNNIRTWEAMSKDEEVKYFQKAVDKVIAENEKKKG